MRYMLYYSRLFVGRVYVCNLGKYITPCKVEIPLSFEGPICSCPKSDSDLATLVQRIGLGGPQLQPFSRIWFFPMHKNLL